MKAEILVFIKMLLIPWEGSLAAGKGFTYSGFCTLSKFRSFLGGLLGTT